MAINFLLKRSNTASKRPTAAQLDIGELSLNYDANTAGVFFEDSAGNVRKVGPVEVSATAPNATPAGSSGNSLGELWYDTGTSNLKVFNGSTFVAATATAGAGGSNTQVQYNSGGTLAGSANFTFDGTTASIAGLAVTGSSIFRAAATQDGIALAGRAGGTSSYEVTLTPTTLSADRTQTLQDAAGTVALSSNKLSFFSATTSAELAGVISDETGSGSLVFATSPSLTTPSLGVASATSINKVAITAPATAATLTIADGKTLTASNTLTFTGTDSSSVAFGTGGTVAYTGGTLAQFASTTSSQLAGVISDETGTGSLVFGTSPTFTTGITLTDTDAGAVLAPTLDLYRDSASPAAQDVLGGLIFNGRDSAANKQEYARVASVIISATSTSESGALAFYTTHAGTAAQERVRIMGSGNVGIGTTAPSRLFAVEGTAETSYTNNPTLAKFSSTNAFAANMGGGVVFGGKYNTAGDITDFAMVSGVKENATDGNYDAALTFGTRTNGSGPGTFERMRIASTGNVGIGSTNPSFPLVVARNQNSATTVQISNSDTGASSVSGLQLQNGASAYTQIITSGAGSYFAIQGVSGIVTQYQDFDTHIWRNGGGVSERMRIASTGVVGIANASPSNGQLELGTASTFLDNNGVTVNRPHTTGLRNGFYATTDQAYNNSSAYSCGGFKANGIASGGYGLVVTTGAAANGTAGTVKAAIDYDGNATFSSNDAGATIGPTLKLQRDSASPAAADIMGGILFEGRDSAANLQSYAQIAGVIEDPTSTSEDGAIALYTVAAGGSLTEKARLSSGGFLGLGTNVPGSLIEMRPQSGTNTAQITIRNSALGDGSPQSLLVGMEGPALGGRAFIDTATAGVAAATPLDFRISTTTWASLDTSGRLLLGGSTTSRTINSSQKRLQVESPSTGSAGISIIQNTGTSTGSAPVLEFGRTRGTTLGSVTAVADGDALGYINFAGANGTNLNDVAASIKAEVDGTPGGSADMPGRLVFSTAPDGSATVSPRMTIKNDGKVGIATTAPGLTLDVGGGSTATSNGGLSNMFLYAGFVPTGGGNTFAGVVLGSGVNGNSPTVAASRNGAGGAAALNLATDGTNRISIDGTGQVGVGVSPSTFFHVSKGGTLPTLDGTELGTFQWNAAAGTSCSVMIVAGTSASSALYFADSGNNDQGYVRYEHVNDALAIGVNNGEKIRVNSGGYFKASDNGTYVGSTSNYHEFNQSGLPRALIVNASNASYAEGALTVDVDRAANVAYSFFQAYSGNFADLEFSLYGDGNGKCDGAWTGGGADYAEFFEWSDGNPGQDDRRGISVVLDGDKIREAAAGEDPFGVISGNPSVVGDAAWNKWSGKYLRDEFGSYILDENGDRQLNPDYDPDLEYVPRDQRPEWGCVGLMGKLRIRKGQVTGSRWIKMRDISDSVEEWLVR